MALGIVGITDSVQSHAQSLGMFEVVTLHEPKSKPTSGLTCGIWADRVAPYPAGSGLNTTTALVVMAVRLYMPMLSQPYDDIDTNMVAAVDALMRAYSGAFTLEGQVREVDLLGESGTSLSGQAGYIEQDRTMYRVYTITLPLIVNDLWAQAS